MVELQLIDHLQHAERRFTKVLRYSTSRRKPPTAAILLDTYDPPAPLHIARLEDALSEPSEAKTFNRALDLACVSIKRAYVSSRPVRNHQQQSSGHRSTIGGSVAHQATVSLLAACRWGSMKHVPIGREVSRPRRGLPAPP